MLCQVARYDVRVELLGFKTATQHGVLVRLGQRVELPFTLEIGDMMEMLEVTAASTVVDMSSMTAGGILATDELLRLPAPRRMTQTLYMVSGVSGSTGTGDANPSIAGASGLDNQYASSVCAPSRTCVSCPTSSPPPATGSRSARSPAGRSSRSGERARRLLEAALVPG